MQAGVFSQVPETRAVQKRCHTRTRKRAKGRRQDHPGGDHQARRRLQAQVEEAGEPRPAGHRAAGLPERLRNPSVLRYTRVDPNNGRRPALVARRRTRDHRVGANNNKRPQARERRAAQGGGAELDEVLGTSPFPTYEDMTKMPYLERCFHESMRLYPQPPVYTRRAVVEDVLPKGLGVVPAVRTCWFLYITCTGRRRTGDPTCRFLPCFLFGALPSVSPTSSTPGTFYTPFSAGPRRCPGDKFAVLEGMAIWRGDVPQAGPDAGGWTRRGHDLSRDDPHSRRDARQRQAEAGRKGSKGGLGSVEAGEGHLAPGGSRRASRRRVLPVAASAPWRTDDDEAGACQSHFFTLTTSAEQTKRV